jgi:hypothetical protein
VNLRSNLIRLAHANPELRPDLLPLIKEASQPKGVMTVSGPFRMYVPPKLSALQTGLQDTLGTVWSLYKNAGMSLGSGPILVALGGNVQSFYDVSGNYVLMTPHHLGKPKDSVLIHEMAHWYHHNVVPGGASNPKVKAKYQWAMASLTPKKSGVVKGMTYEKPGWDNPHTKDIPYTRIYKVVSVTKTKSTVEIQNPSAFDKKHRPHLREEMPTSYLEAKLNPRGVVQDAHGASHTEGGISAWVPSEYAKTNEREWFAELVTPHVLHPAGTDPAVKAWLNSLVG